MRPTPDTTVVVDVKAAAAAATTPMILFVEGMRCSSEPRSGECAAATLRSTRNYQAIGEQRREDATVAGAGPPSAVGRFTLHRDKLD